VQVVELTDDAVFAQHCKGGGGADAKQLCFVAFLPDILDSKAEDRNKYIAVLKKMADAFKDRPYSYLWAVGGAHSALEASVDVGGFGYPALVALSPRKEVFVPHKGALAWEQAREFVGGIRTGAKAAAKLRQLLQPLSSVAAWDGKDGVVAAEEEFSLDDIMNS
jgi:protein disulfide-isomerase A6